MDLPCAANLAHRGSNLLDLGTYCELEPIMIEMPCPLEIVSGVSVTTSGQLTQVIFADHRIAAAIRFDNSSTTMVITRSSRTRQHIDLHFCG